MILIYQVLIGKNIYHTEKVVPLVIGDKFGRIFCQDFAICFKLPNTDSLSIKIILSKSMARKIKVNWNYKVQRQAP